MGREESGRAFLDQLERAEAAFLSWGLVDWQFQHQELLDRADAFIEERADAGLDSTFDDPDDLLDWMEQRRLLWPTDGSHAAWRTRTAETVRLIARLRQIFPQRSWRESPNLVSDFRFLLRPRSYPRLRYGTDETLSRIDPDGALSLLQRDVVRALLRADTDQPWLLREFQADATARILAFAGGGKQAGTIVCAGTGSGKTLAFYLPAFTRIAARLTSAPSTKCLALYPRNELLKDQLKEALAQARRLTAATRKHGRRDLVLGALYGEVPHNPDEILKGKPYLRAWTRQTVGGKNAYRCPYIDCPECGSSLLWTEDDIRASTERLYCGQSECDAVIEPSQIRLSRRSLLESPADVLFTTTEMLNQRMGSAQFGPLFGVGAAKPPELVLLDEVHTYDDIHGAQVGCLLRRWQRLARARPHFVGLSATLADAARFFADIAGLWPGSVEEVSPRPGEMEHVSAEYLLALRGDPVSGTSLLATTIQTAMLLRRVLDPKAEPSEGAFGTKVFAFTDTLDVTNRLYHDLQDAEGWRGRRQPNNRGESLAVLRRRDGLDGDHRERLRHGQAWDLVEWIGHSLAPGTRAIVERTSSQDAGVDTDADIVVATSSLELGFDDPAVGAVLQHKAPRSDASFLQRKGRAGRPQGMRPWTVVVLSDYGRDRIAYQAYDQLFSPDLVPRTLPLQNRYVLRMQATYALMDWLGTLVPRSLGPEPWQDFGRPGDDQGPPWERQRYARQRIYAAELAQLLTDDARLASFATFLGQSLAVDEDTVQALLWDPPRALVTAVVPTLLRRIERDWKRVDRPGALDPRGDPLPEFVPRSLFSDLNLPEVLIGLPRPREGEELMPVLQALTEFAPGRASKRFGVTYGDEAYWVPVEPCPDGRRATDEFVPAEDAQELGDFQCRAADGAVVSLPVVRPYRISVDRLPRNVAASSNARLVWQTQLVPRSDGLSMDVPEPSRWSGIVESVVFHTHGLARPVEMRRFATGARYQITVQRETREGEISFTRGVDASPVAIGFAIEVDALAIGIRVPADLRERAANSPDLARGLRPARFRDAVAGDDRLDGVANTFQRGWLAEIFLAALTACALDRECSLEEAVAVVAPDDRTLAVGAVLGVIFQSLMAAEDESAEATRGKRHEELSNLLAATGVIRVLREAAHALWEPIGEEWDRWLRSRFCATLGSAALGAVQHLCHEFGPDAAWLDIDPGPRVEHVPPDDVEEIWITETTPGGAGFVEKVLTTYGVDPRRFMQAVDASLQASDLEEVDHQLRRVLEWLDPTSESADEQVQEAVRAFRAAKGHAEAEQAFAGLRRILSRSGLLVCHPVMSALSTRILRLGSSPATDQALSCLLRRWDAAEERLGIEVDTRVFAYGQSEHDLLDQVLRDDGPLPPESEQRHWRYATVYGLLWARGSAIRREALRIHSPFLNMPDCDRQLVTAALPEGPQPIRIELDDWRELVRKDLVESGSALVSAGQDDGDKLSDAIRDLMADPIDADVVLVYPCVERVTREGDRIHLRLTMPEAAQ